MARQPKLRTASNVKPKTGEVTLEMNDAAVESLWLNFGIEILDHNIEQLKVMHKLLGEVIAFETQT